VDDAIENYICPCHIHRWYIHSFNRITACQA